MVREAGVFRYGPHVPTTHIAYFKPPVDALVTTLKKKGLRAAQEWEYTNAAGD